MEAEIPAEKSSFVYKGIPPLTNKMKQMPIRAVKRIRQRRLMIKKPKTSKKVENRIEHILATARVPASRFPKPILLKNSKTISLPFSE
jgi:hypothetical protein